MITYTYSTGINAIRKGDIFDESDGYYAVGQYGIDIAGPFALQDDAIKAVLKYVENHPATTPSSGKPVLVCNEHL